MVLSRHKVDGVVVWVHLEGIPMHFKCIIGSRIYHDTGEGQSCSQSLPSPLCKSRSVQTDL